MEDRSYIRSAKIIGFFTLVSRVLGMVRDIFCTAIFGATMIWDAFQMAFLVPNLFRRLFGEGALTAAFVPVFVEKMEKDGKPAAVRLLNTLLKMLVVVLSVVVIAGIAVTLIVPHFFTDPKIVLICELLRITLPYLLIICVVAILGAALNSMNHFVTPALAPILMNVTWIGALALFSFGWMKDSTDRIFVLSWAVLVGGVLGLLVQIPSLVRREAHLTWEKTGPAGGMREILALFVPAAFGLAVVQINEMIDYFVAEVCVPGDGAVSALSYGSHVMQLPLAMIGTAVATAIFPLFSSQPAKENPHEFNRLFQRAMRSTLFIALPAAVGMMILSEPIIQLLFERGKFDHAATIRTAKVLLFYGSGLWCFCCNQILIRVFYSRKDTLTPVKISASMVLLNVVLNLILVWPLREAGLALATAISGLVNMVVLLIVLRRKMPGVSIATVVPMGIRALLATALMAVTTLGVYHSLNDVSFASGPSVLSQAAHLGLAMAAGMIVYFMTAFAFRMEEIKDWVHWKRSNT